MKRNCHTHALCWRIVNELEDSVEQNDVRNVSPKAESRTAKRNFLRGSLAATSAALLAQYVQGPVKPLYRTNDKRPIAALLIRRN